MDHDISLSFVIPWACKLMLLACILGTWLTFICWRKGRKGEEIWCLNFLMLSYGFIMCCLFLWTCVLVDCITFYLSSKLTWKIYWCRYSFFIPFMEIWGFTSQVWRHFVLDTIMQIPRSLIFLKINFFIANAADSGGESNGSDDEFQICEICNSEEVVSDLFCGFLIDDVLHL